jgi:hypothetical protein
LSKRRPNFITYKILEITYIRSKVPTGPKTSNCASKGQEQFTRKRKKSLVVSFKGLGAKTN